MRYIFCRITQFFVKVFYSLLGSKQPEIVSKPDAINSLSLILKKYKITNPLLVVNNTVLKLGYLDSLRENFQKENIKCTVFKDIEPNPTIKNVNDGYQIYEDNKCDSIIAIGGGSQIDAAKIIGARASNPKKSVSKLAGVLKIKNKLPPLFVAPTTAGTGSEATAAAVITDEKTHHKFTIIDPKLTPIVAILDPKLTVSLPPFFTSTTGMDAFCHAVESYTNWFYCTKVEKDAAKKATKLIFENIFEAYSNGNNLNARENMQNAALLAGIAFNRGSVGYVHAIGHTVGGLYGIPHGLAMSIILPYVLKEYGKSTEKHLSELADYCAIDGNNPHEKSINFINWIEENNKMMGIPNKIPEIQEKDISKMIKWAMKESNPLYPCPQVWGKKKFEKVIKQLIE